MARFSPSEPIAILKSRFSKVKLVSLKLGYMKFFIPISKRIPFSSGKDFKNKLRSLKFT